MLVHFVEQANKLFVFFFILLTKLEKVFAVLKRRAIGIHEIGNHDILSSVLSQNARTKKIRNP